MGRMACMTTAGHSEDIVWTTDYGKMLGVAIGSGSSTRRWLWWVAVHHNIISPGQRAGQCLSQGTRRAIASGSHC